MQKPLRHFAEISDQQALELLHQSVADVRRLADRSLQMIIDTEEALSLASKMESPLLTQPRGGGEAVPSVSIGRGWLGAFLLFARPTSSRLGLAAFRSLVSF
jgi:hypothetical protein